MLARGGNSKRFSLLETRNDEKTRNKLNKRLEGRYEVLTRQLSSTGMTDSRTTTNVKSVQAHPDYKSQI
jgi:hypothetical protein